MVRAIVAGAVAFLWASAAWAGYSHYWRWRVPPDEAALRLAVADMRRLAAARRDIVDVEAHDADITLNGIGDAAHEPFVFPGRPGQNFVKTLGKPYDEVVVACLLAAQARFPGDTLEIASDGGPDEWADGRALFAAVLGRASGGGASARLASLTGYVYPLLIALLFYLVVLRRGGASWSSYYLFWLLVPALASFVLAFPALLLVVPAALLLRPWLPDPWLALKHARRVRSLDAQVRANPANASARRDLAVIWLEKRRPARALPLVEQAQRREPDSVELHYLRGLALLGARRPDEAVDAFLEVLRREPRFRYGDAYLRAADALMALGRWEQAEEGLETYLEVNRSSVEGPYKLGLVRRARGDGSGAHRAFRQAAEIYQASPSFHRRRQLGWYLRARLRDLRA